MEIEKPKVEHNIDEDVNAANELAFLVKYIFDTTEEGKRLLTKLKDLYISDKNKGVIFPINPNVLAQFGNSVEIYSGFRMGQASVIFQIEQLIEYCKQMEAKQTKPKE